LRLSLTKRGEYGVRIMVHLAVRRDGGRMTAQELAEACSIPVGNVPTIVNLLSRSGLLLSTPGRHGGCVLARAPETISMLEIVECLEGTFDVSHCLLDSRRCHDKDPECALHTAWKAGRDAAIGSLANTTLATTAHREAELRGLANPPRSTPDT
jgi:Rrf2 family protein